MLLGGERELRRVLAVMAATALTIAGAAILNNYVERHGDARMERTRSRPTASGALAPRRALVAGVVALGVGVAGVGLSGGPLAAALAATGAAYYVVVYTIFLKPHTALSALPGGLAGVFPAAIGWAAAGAPRSSQVLVLCALIILWSPAHFWSLSLAVKEQYAAAGIPTPALAYGPRVAAIQIFAAATASVALTLAAIPLELFGPVYAVVSVAAGSAFWLLGLALAVDEGPQRARLLHKLSGPYLASVVIAMLV
jgi:protoheme IX farnesyltransferase